MNQRRYNIDERGTFASKGAFDAGGVLRNISQPSKEQKTSVITTEVMHAGVR